MEGLEKPVEGQEDNQPSEVEKKARENGWRPKEEFDGDGWVDAEEYEKRAPLYKRLGAQSKRIREMEKTLTHVSGHMTKVQEATYRRAVEELQARRDMAIEEADKDTVKSIDKEIGALEKELQPNPVPVDPAITAWENDPANAWYQSDKEMQGFALAFAQNYVAQHPETRADVEIWLKAMEKAVKRAFPEKFENEKRRSPSPVDTGGSPGGLKKYTMSDLNDMQKRVLRDMERAGVINDKFTRDEYIQQLADIGEVGGKK